MSIQLVKENDPILRKVADPWDFTVDGDPTVLCKNLARCMIENNGIGLAAPQCGVSKRIFVMGNETKLYACINPEILNGDDLVMGTEGCLSFPELWLKVKRHDVINVRYQTPLGDTVETTFTGLVARVFQHEKDHLDGICYDTKVAKLSLEMAMNRRKKRSGKSFY
jgi:peptide deformylase